MSDGTRNEIPKFDLAEQIMAEQRKNASVTRKGPARKVQLPKQPREVELVVHAMKSQAVPPGEEQVIAEIVARDIEKLCRRNS